MNLLKQKPDLTKTKRRLHTAKRLIKDQWKNMSVTAKVMTVLLVLLQIKLGFFLAEAFHDLPAAGVVLWILFSFVMTLAAAGLNHFITSVLKWLDSEADAYEKGSSSNRHRGSNRRLL